MNPPSYRRSQRPGGIWTRVNESVLDRVANVIERRPTVPTMLP